MPVTSTPANTCWAAAARTASTATSTLPSVRFLKPTGIESPDPSWRWIWLSVVRAPIAPQRHGVGDVLGHDRVEELAADRQAEREHVEQQPARHAQPGVDVARPVEVRVVDHPLPPDRRARLLEVHAHRDAAGRPRARRPSRAAGGRTPGRRRCRARCTGRRPRAAGRRGLRGSPRCLRRPCRTTSACSGDRGSSCSISAGVTSGMTCSMRWSRTCSLVLGRLVLIGPSLSSGGSTCWLCMGVHGPAGTALGLWRPVMRTASPKPTERLAKSPGVGVGVEPAEVAAGRRGRERCGGGAAWPVRTL